MDRGSLVVELKVGDSISIDGGRVVMTLQNTKSQRACLHFSAERSVPIDPVRERAAIQEVRQMGDKVA